MGPRLAALIRWLAAASVLFLAGVEVPAAPPNDDPLPAGAVVRLGAVRLRHVGMADFVPSRDGTTAATVACDRFVRTWDLATGRQMREVALAGEGLLTQTYTTLSADGRTAAGLDQGKLIVWDAASGRELKTLPLPGPANDLAFRSEEHTSELQSLRHLVC